MKGDGEGDLAQHGEAEQRESWKETTQDLGRELESAGAELVGDVARSSTSVFSNCFEDRQNLVEIPDFTCPGGGSGGRRWWRRGQRSVGRCREGAGWACQRGAAEREGGNGEERMRAARSGRRSSAQTAGPAASAGVGEQWSAGKWCSGAAEEGSRRGRGCMGRRERGEAPERARRPGGWAPL